MTVHICVTKDRSKVIAQHSQSTILLELPSQ